MTSRESREVTKQFPCPICNKSDWCLWLDGEKNKILCNRTMPGTEPVGWNQFEVTKDGKPLYKNDLIYDKITSPVRSSKSNTIPSWSKPIPSGSFSNSFSSNSKVGYQKRRIKNLGNLISAWEKFPLLSVIQKPNFDITFPEYRIESPAWYPTGRDELNKLGMPIYMEKEIHFPYEVNGGEKEIAEVRVTRRQWSDRRLAYQRGSSKPRSKLVFPQFMERGKWKSGTGKGVEWEVYRSKILESELMESGGILFVVGGEIAVEALRFLGFPATCTQGGEGSNLDSLVRFMDRRGALGDKIVRSIVLVPDNDEAGIKACDRTRLILDKAHPEIPVVVAPLEFFLPPSCLDWVIPVKGDFADLVNFLISQNCAIDRQQIKTAVSEGLKSLLVSMEAELQDRRTGSIRSTVQSVQPFNLFNIEERVMTEMIPQSQVVRLQDSKVHESKAADLLLPLLQDRVVWCPERTAWFEYRRDKTAWIAKDDSGFSAVIIDLLRKMGITYTARLINSIKELLRPSLRKDPVDHPWNPTGCVPFSNGVLELNSDCANFIHNVDPNHRFFFFDYNLGYDYNPNAKCPKIERWLFEMAGIEISEVLVAYLAGCHRGMGGSLQMFLELVGGPGTGKGTWLRLMSGSLGLKGCVSTTLKQFEGRFESYRFQNKRCIQITDAHEFGGDPAAFKSITGGDLIRIESKNNNYKDDDRYTDALIVLAANESPKFTTGHEALSRRRIPVLLNKPIDPSVAKEMFDPKPGGHGWMGELADELPGLFNWVMSFSPKDITRILKNKHRLSLINQQSLMEIQVQSDPLFGWMEDCLYQEITSDSESEEPTLRTPIGLARKEIGSLEFTNWKEHLYPSYRQWLIDNGHDRPLPIQHFRTALLKALKQVGSKAFHKRSSNGSAFYGIGIRDQQNPDYGSYPSLCGVNSRQLQFSMKVQEERKEMEATLELQEETCRELSASPQLLFPNPFSSVLSFSLMPETQTTFGSGIIYGSPSIGLIEKENNGNNKDTLELNTTNKGEKQIMPTSSIDTQEVRPKLESELESEAEPIVDLKTPQQENREDWENPEVLNQLEEQYKLLGVTQEILIEMLKSYAKSPCLQKYGIENIHRFFRCHGEDWRSVWDTLSSADRLI